MRARVTFVALGLAAASVALGAAADEWPQWRGPARTGVLAAAEAPAAWPQALKKGWSVAVGEGYSSPVVSSGRVFVHGRRGTEEVVSAIDLATGKVAWEQKYPAPAAKNPYAKEMALGPYSTPLVDAERVYTLGTTAILSAWNVKTGALVWRKDFSPTIDTSKLFCGTATSPLQTKDGVVVHVGDDRARRDRRVRSPNRTGALDPRAGRCRIRVADGIDDRRRATDCQHDDEVGRRRRG